MNQSNPGGLAGTLSSVPGPIILGEGSDGLNLDCRYSQMGGRVVLQGKQLSTGVSPPAGEALHPMHRSGGFDSPRG